MIELPENKTAVGSKSKTIHVDVLYPPEITANWTHTVIEGYNINISCTDSPGRTSQQSIEWMKNQGHITLNNNLTIENVTRQHSGLYTCFVNYSMIPTYGETKTEVLTRGIYIDVQCSPRLSPNVEIQQNITTSEHGLAIFSFVAVAFPRPHFKWFRKTNSTILEANNGFTTVQIISENEMRIYFIVTNVALTDFGEYVLTINNTRGGYQQSYFLREQAQISCTAEVAEVVPLGITAGVATGSVITTLMIVAVVYTIHKRFSFRGKQQNQLNNSSEHREIPQYQNIATDGISTGNVSCSPNIYEGLQAMGTDQQYLELSALYGNNKAGRNNVYVNLPHRTTE